LLRSWRISRRTVQTTGLAGLATGTVAALAAIAVVGLSAAQANATAGAQAGALKISPSSGPVTASGLRYAATTACPSGKNGSAVVRLVDPGTGATANASTVNNSVASPFSGSLNATFAQLAAVFPDIAGTTSEMAVFCFSGASATGTSVAVQDTFVTITADGANYTISNSGGPTTTTTAAPTSTESAASTGGDTIPIGVTVASGASATATPTAAPATGGGTGPGSNLALAAAGATVALAGGGLILLARQRRRQGAG
jgi:hypothetical protein